VHCCERQQTPLYAYFGRFYKLYIDARSDLAPRTESEVRVAAEGPFAPPRTAYFR
jgi:hypothetical protein